MNRIAYTREALKAFQRMPVNVAETIQKKIGQYARDPESLANNVKKLRARPGYRLRIGDWRVIFDREGNILSILQIGPRGSIYED